MIKEVECYKSIEDMEEINIIGEWRLLEDNTNQPLRYADGEYHYVVLVFNEAQEGHSHFEGRMKNINGHFIKYQGEVSYKFRVDDKKLTIITNGEEELFSYLLNGDRLTLIAKSFETDIKETFQRIT